MQATRSALVAEAAAAAVSLRELKDAPAPRAPGLNRTETALLEFGRWLRQQDYEFVTVTPETQRRVLARAPGVAARDLREAFGWSRPFDEALLPFPARRLLEQADALAREGAWLRSRVRFSTLDGLLLAHSAFPTTQSDAVFFGPDSVRFAAFLRRAARDLPRPFAGRIADVGCGTGVGALALSRVLGDTPRWVLSDVNRLALSLARVNAALNGLAAAEFIPSDLLARLGDPLDLVIANPPYLADAEVRLYRDGGAGLGTALSVRLVREALLRLAPGGTLLLYTGTPVIAGEDLFRAAVEPLLRAAQARYDYVEIDPDVFGEELERPEYREAERIAAVGLIARTFAPELA